MTWVYFLKHKSEVYSKLLEFYNMVKTQFNVPVKILRIDNGGEYQSSEFRSFFTINGLLYQTACPNTPQQNGVAEQKNRILLEMARAMILESQVPSSYWPEAVATATYLTNLLPSSVLNHKTLWTFSPLKPLFHPF